ncbi:type IV toxin-antitoxin system AbiEi family antitoxin domain-containing protein [Isoptericola cucumis]|uniref:AbiEi antitoxin of type IV toxin-antitoxin system n=1 Tax=Isoptericola cucumis TaxID=1776856 RepID=A0ABQ2B8G3_9MICO|nr:type IV toxin-antitoxin system AbiEi family antitoxin domain-containing protein [Isoptericola cucumis]GGI07685.1 hypothetical protein GCM10007368_17400 [Isoptericola cucumis]
MRPLKKIPEEVLGLARRQEDLVSAAQADACGVDPRWQARMVGQGRWVRVTTGVYDTDPVPAADRPKPDALDHRRRRAAWIGLLAHGPTAVAVGQAALALHGVQGLPLVVRPEVMVAGGHHRRARDGIVVRQLDPAVGVVEASGGRVAAVVHALGQAVPTLDRRHAVAVLDNAVHQDLIARAEVEAAHDLARGRRGVERTHGWWRLTDGRAESPLETFARLDCLDAGVPPDDLQHVVEDPDGRFLGRSDLAWSLPDGRWVLLEVDGVGVHSAPEALLEDRRRQNRLVAEGGVLIQRATWAELRVPGRVGDRMADLLVRLGWRQRDVA